MVSFYNPQQEQEIKRKRAYAAQLMKQSEQTPNEMVSGVMVEKSPLEGFAKALGMGMGTYNQAQASGMEAETEANRQKMIGDALAQYKENPEAAATMLAQDPRTSDMAAKILQGEVDYERKQERYAQEDALKREYYQSGGGTKTPAPVQIADKMWQLQQIATDVNKPIEERQAANTQYNLIGQAAKTYGYTGGLEKNFINSEPQPMPELNQAPVNNPSPNMTMKPELVNQPVAPMNQPIQPAVQPISGYADAAASIAGTKKAAEAKAEKLNAAMPSAIVKEQNDLIDKVNVAQGLEASMNKFVGQIDAGGLDLGLMANLENKARNKVGMSTEESRNLTSFKSTLERLRNESLRLNTGVQTDGDAQRAWKELIDGIEDPLNVRQRLNEIAEINRKGALLQNQKLNIMRNEYGRGEMNIPNIYAPSQPAANQPAPKLQKNADGSYNYGF
jgi:hypothetical protein